MEKNKVKLTISGTDYNILSDDNEEYIIEIGKQIDKRMTEVLSTNSRLSTTMAAILISLEYCDVANKKDEAIRELKDKLLRYPIEDYSQLEEAKFEVELLNEEIVNLKKQIEYLTNENKNLSEKVCELEEIKKQINESFLEDDEDYNEDILNFFDFQKIAEN